MRLRLRLRLFFDRLKLRLITSRGPPYPSRSPRAHPSGWTRTQGLVAGTLALVSYWPLARPGAEKTSAIVSSLRLRQTLQQG